MSVTGTTPETQLLARFEQIKRNGFGKLFVELRTLQDGTISTTIEYSLSDKIFSKKQFDLDNFNDL